MENPNETGGPGGRRDPLRDLQSRVEEAVDDVRPKIRRALEELETKVEEAIADIRPRAQSAMRDVQPKIDQFVTDVQPRLDSLLERLQQRIEELRRDLDARVSRDRAPLAELPRPEEPAAGTGEGPGAPGTMP
ncbi:MAG TPA: hypothetical protein VK939_03175 [Longimicrobiales bacterium]|nr:hypothetical protein [Longimicrobiales bacterium]